MSIESDVRALATDDGRDVGTEGHHAAKNHIRSRLLTLGVEPYLPQGFDVEYQCEGQDFCNLLAMVSGKDRSLSPVLLGAHYDTCGDIPGADDNAAAVAVLLDVAARMAARPPVRSVVFGFFDAEEPPYFLSPSMGSIRFYEDQRVGDIHCAVIMDLVGHDVPVPGLEDLLFVTGMESNRELGEVIESCPVDTAIRILPILNSYVGDMSDHHVFRVNRVPYIFLSCGIWPHYHQYTDTPDRLNYGKVEGIARYLEGITESISGKGLTGEFEGYDSTGIEIGFIQDVLLPVVARMGVSLNVETRQDVDWLVGMMRDQFGI
jgi:hypothetical protein